MITGVVYRDGDHTKVAAILEFGWNTTSRKWEVVERQVDDDWWWTREKLVLRASKDGGAEKVVGILLQGGHDCIPELLSNATWTLQKHLLAGSRPPIDGAI